MEILLPTNEKFNLNQPTSKLIDSKMCVFDYSDKEDCDFYYKKITSFISYRYPTVTLALGEKYTLELPLNWRIMITNNYDYICQLIPVEELLHYQQQTLIFNPFYNSIPMIKNITIKGINPTPVEVFVPKLPRKNLLVLPIGNKKDWDNVVLDRHTGERKVYPDCIMACDDLDNSKFEMELGKILI